MSADDPASYSDGNQCSELFRAYLSTNDDAVLSLFADDEPTFAEHLPHANGIEPSGSGGPASGVDIEDGWDIMRTVFVCHGTEEADDSPSQELERVNLEM